MTIEFPRELPDVGYVTADFLLRDAVTPSPAGKGLINYTDVAPPVWEASLTTRGLVESQYAAVEAWWMSLRSGLRTVLFRHPYVCYPKNHAGNPAPALTAGRLVSIASGNVLSVDGVDPALSLVAGDRIGLEYGNRWYVGRLTDVSGSGAARTLTVEPLPPSNIAQVGAVVRWVRPGCLMRPVPDSFQAPRSGRFYTVSFKLTEVFGTGSVPRDMYWNFTSTASVGSDFSRASGATYWGADGFLKTAAAHEPRIEYDPVTHEWLGLLMEEQRTNLATWSEAFDTGAYNKVRASVVPDATVAPDGNMTADKLVEDTSNNSHVIGQFVNITADTTYVFSIFAKAAGRSRIRSVFSATGFSGTSTVYFDLSTGTVGSASGPAILESGMIPCGGGWYRCWAKLTANVTVNTYYETRIAVEATDTYEGDGASGVYLWGRQVEAGAFLTSYIPTTTASATRAPDLPVIPALDWLADGVGTLLIEFITPVAGAGATLACITQGATGYGTRLQWGYNSTMSTLYFVNVPPSPLSPNSLPLPNMPGVVRYATAWDDTLMSAVQNGGAVAQMVPTNPIPRDLSYLRLGTTGGTFLFNGHIKRVAYFPRRLSNAELVSLTS